MQVKLSENIRLFRKSRGLTQEQLAEVLNVSVGVISKWELGLSTPELGIIMQLAEFFETSVDVLLGYQMQNRGREETVELLKDYCQQRNREFPFAEIERYLKKYPFDFDVVYRSAVLYEVRGYEGGDQRLLQRGRELFELASHLIDQNGDETISQTAIQTRIAQLHINLGEEEKGVSLLKANNPGGLNDALIGQTLASVCDRPEEGMSYLSEAVFHALDEQTHLAIGLINVFEKRRDFQSMVEAMDWILTVQRAYSIPGRINFLNKMAALYLICRGYACLKLNRMEDARRALEEARAEAMAFDANPDYSSEHFRFVKPKRATCYDDFGATAMEGIQKFMIEQNEPELTALWAEICG